MYRLRTAARRRRHTGARHRMARSNPIAPQVSGHPAVPGDSQPTLSFYVNRISLGDVVRGMRQLAASVALVLLVGGCSQSTPGDTAAPAPPPAFSGRQSAAIPSQVPTVGKRPPTDNLPQAAEPQSGSAGDGPHPRTHRGRRQGARRRRRRRRHPHRGHRQARPQRARADERRHRSDRESGATARSRTALATVQRRRAGPGTRSRAPARWSGSSCRVGGRCRRPSPASSHDAAQADNGTVFVSNEHGGTVTSCAAFRS